MPGGTTGCSADPRPWLLDYSDAGASAAPKGVERVREKRLGWSVLRPREREEWRWGTDISLGLN